MLGRTNWCKCENGLQFSSKLSWQCVSAMLCGGADKLVFLVFQSRKACDNMRVFHFTARRLPGPCHWKLGGNYAISRWWIGSAVPSDCIKVLIGMTGEREISNLLWLTLPGSLANGHVNDHHRSIIGSKPQQHCFAPFTLMARASSPNRTWCKLIANSQLSRFTTDFKFITVALTKGLWDVISLTNRIIWSSINLVLGAGSEL